MGRSKNYKKPEDPQLEIEFEAERVEKEADVVLSRKKEKNYGVIIHSAERLHMRIWLLLSNPFRYLFTGRTRF